MYTDTAYEPALNWKACIALSHLSDDEFEAQALDCGAFARADEELTHYLAMSPVGEPYLRAIIGEQITEAILSGDVRRSSALKHVLLQYMRLFSLAD